MLLKLLSLLSLGVGVFIIIQLVMPLVAFATWEVQAVDKDSVLVSPAQQTTVQGVSVQTQGNFPAFISSNAQTDLPYQSFLLSIPSIKVTDMTVRVASNDFNNTPAQLPGTALPGERGNVFISGHSSLPQLLKSSGAKAVFSTLPGIKKDDDIYIQAGGQSYHYVVQGLKIVDPSEVSVLNPPDNEGRYLSLMTCVPPGFNLKRLVVLAKLQI